MRMDAVSIFLALSIRNFGFRVLQIEKSARDWRIRVDAPVAEEGPVAARVFKEPQINFTNQNFFFLVRGLRNDAAERIGKKTAAPEFKARAAGAIATNIAG